MKITFSGFDSAWGGRARGAFCDLDGQVNDGSLSLTIREMPVRVNWPEAVDRLNSEYSELANHVLAIDQGLVVPNLDGQRIVERKLASALMNKYGCGCHSSNRSKQSCYGANAGIWKFMEALENAGYSHNPMNIASQCKGRSFFECYPHPALIGLFNLDGVLKYKVSKKNPEAWKSLVDRLHSLQNAQLSIRNIREFIPTDFPQNKGNEDILDAVIAAYVAAYFWFYGIKKSNIIGKLNEGYIVTPVNEDMKKLIQSKFDADEINQSGDAPKTPKRIQTTIDKYTPNELDVDRKKVDCFDMVLTAKDHTNLWGNVNDWMIQDRCEGWLLYVRFIDQDSEPEVVFGPFNKQGVQQFGMKPWDPESKLEWRIIAEGATNANQLTFPVRIRYIPLNP